MHATDIFDLSDRQHCLVILNDSLFASHSLSKRQCDHVMFMDHSIILQEHVPAALRLP